ncbi:MAG: N-6 DNA methylase [Acidimicrobiia bacterium]
MATRANAEQGLEQRLWDMADALRGSMDASEYKNVVLGLIFLKYVSDAFEARREELEAAIQNPKLDLYFEDYDIGVEIVVEDRDRYAEANVFWVPPEARWDVIQSKAKQADIGEIIDDAMLAIEHDNDRLKGVLPVGYANPTLDKRRLGEVVDLISGIGFHDIDKDRDILGRVYEYFLLKFDMAYGRAAGEFYTPRDVVQLLVEMVEPYEGRIYDPCCGSGGMFVQSAKFVEAHGGSVNNIAVYGQESNPTTWKLAKMNLALKGIEADLGDQWADTFANDKHPDLKADFALSNPPYNIDSWHRVEDDPRWKYGVPPARNSNFGWMQHILHHLAPGGTAGVVMANGTLTTEQSGEHHIRRKMLEDDVVDCIVTLPTQLFYTTQIPVCLWFFSRARGGQKAQRNRTGEVLFINAKHTGEMVSRTNRQLTKDDIAKIAGAYHAWRGTSEETYEDEAGFCRSVDLDEIWQHDGVLTPGRYVGMAETEDDGEPFDEKMERLVAELAEHFARDNELQERIRRNLKEVGYDL